MEIDISGRKFQIRELLASEFDKIDFSSPDKGLKEQVILSTGMSSDEYSSLTVRERTAIVKAILEINDFQVQPK